MMIPWLETLISTEICEFSTSIRSIPGPAMIREATVALTCSNTHFKRDTAILWHLGVVMYEANQQEQEWIYYSPRPASDLVLQGEPRGVYEWPVDRFL